MEDTAAGRERGVLMVSMAEIVGWVGSQTETPEVQIERVSGVDDAGPGSIVFATDRSTMMAAVGSGAAAILAGGGVPVDAGAGDRRVLRVGDARYAFAEVARRLAGVRAEGRLDVTAIFAEEAEIGERTEVGPGVVVGRGVRIGSDCRIDAGVCLYSGTRLGDRVVVQAGAVLGSAGFGYARHGGTGEYLLFPQQGTLAIEDDVEIGANTTIDRGALGETRIGRGTKIDNLVHIGHNCRIGRNVIIAAQTGISGSSVVEDGAILGGQVGIGEHATVGEGVILGGGAGVLSGKKMRGAGEVFWGRPARPLKEYLRDLARLRRGR